MSNQSRPHYSNRTTAAVVDLSALGFSGTLRSFWVENTHSATVYLQIFTTSSPNVGTTAPAQSFALAPGVSGGFFGDGLVFKANAGWSYAVTSTRNGSGAPGAAVDVNLQAS